MCKKLNNTMNRKKELPDLEANIKKYEYKIGYFKILKKIQNKVALAKEIRQWLRKLAALRKNKTIMFDRIVK